MFSDSSHEARHLAHAAILQQLAEGVIVTDAVGTITFVNDAAAAIHGVARLDIKPNAYADTYHLFREDGRPYPSDELPLARAVRGETVKEARWRIMRPNGRQVLAIGTAQPLRDANGRRIGAVLTLRDATAQDAAERSLHKSQTELRDIRDRLSAPVESTADAPPVQPRRAPQDIGRQLRAPLREMLAQAQWLLQASTLEDARVHAKIIRATGGALLSLCDSLLGIADAERDAAAAAPKTLPPRQAGRAAG